MRTPIAFRNIVLMGFGNIGQALSPLLRQRHPTLPIQVFDEHMRPEQVAVAEQHGMAWQRVCITQANHVAVLGPWVDAHTLVVNVATSISSHDLIQWAQAHGAFYLDTCIDPWAYQDGALHDASNTNYRMREQVMALQARQQASGQPMPTAVVAHGANPGLVSVLAKEAMLMMAARHLSAPAAPCGQVEWALLAQALGLRVIQISERDTQRSPQARQPNEFVNTWSVDGFVAEALQPVELGWGTHEATGPLASQARHHSEGCRAAVYFSQMGVHAQVRSWTPHSGEFVGRLISHNEAISLAAYLTVKDQGQDQGQGEATYRPTVYYAYHPCDQAMDSLALLQPGHRQDVHTQRVLKAEITEGIDELGVLLISDRYPSLWLGSQLSIAQARAIAPHNNATSLQVVGSMVAAMAWIQAHPRRGIVESEALDHDFLMAQARPYWAPIVHEQRAWHPQGRVDSARWTLDEFLVGSADQG